jgi:hypothetical protein
MESTIVYKRGDKVRVVDTGRGLVMDSYAGEVGIIANFEPAGTVDPVFNLPTPNDGVNIWFEDKAPMSFEESSKVTWETGLFSAGLDGVELAD